MSQGPPPGVPASMPSAPDPAPAVRWGARFSPQVLVLVATADDVREHVPPCPEDVVCGLGAGDAFGGAVCHGLLSGWDLVRSVRAGNAAGAIVAGRLMCADAMPTDDEITAAVEMRDMRAQYLDSMDI